MPYGENTSVGQASCSISDSAVGFEFNVNESTIYI